MLRATVNAVADRREQILLVIANCSYICEELKNAGGDTHRQNEFVNHVGRYLVEHGFQPWIREQGGWVSDTVSNKMSLNYVILYFRTKWLALV